MSPRDIKTAYNINPIPTTGSGQIVALVELNGFNPSDIQAYEDAYGLPHIPIQIVSVDGSTNVISTINLNMDQPAEPTLDIEMVAALAPGLRLIRVYQAPYGNSDGTSAPKQLLDVFNRVASDNTNLQVSISYGTTENRASSSMLQSENTAFESGTLTGMSFFASSGDFGAYSDSKHTNFTVNDPASQPFVCGVGGTTLGTDQYANRTSETTWNAYGAASGGGASDYWAIPSWQAPLITVASGASTRNRNVPDVCLNAFPNYSIYFAGGWTTTGGTSAASPLWAAFTALVNSQMLSPGYGAIWPIGDVNVHMYRLAQSARYSLDFYDIADHSSNGTFYAVPGYDRVTGLGSFNGANLFTDLVATKGSYN